MFFWSHKLTSLIIIVSLFLVQSCSLQDCNCEELTTELEEIKSNNSVLRDTIIDRSVELRKAQLSLELKKEEISFLEKNHHFIDSIKNEKIQIQEELIKVLQSKD